MKKLTFLELLMLATLPLAKDIPLELEQMISANSTQAKAFSRIHLGYQIGNFTCGIAAEADYGTKVPFAPKAGLYLRLKSK